MLFLKLLKHSRYRIHPKTTIIKIVLINSSGDVGSKFFVLLIDSLNWSYRPCAEVNSIHPWSAVFKDWCAIIIGVFNIHWVDKGTKNHIIQDAWWSILSFKSLAFIVVVRLVWVNPIKKPNIIAFIGSNLYEIGRDDTDV